MLEKYIELRKKVPSAKEFGDWLKDPANMREWHDVYFLEVVQYAAELDFKPAKAARLPDFSNYFENRDWDGFEARYKNRISEFIQTFATGKFFVWSSVCVLFEIEDDALLFKILFNSEHEREICDTR